MPPKTSKPDTSYGFENVGSGGNAPSSRNGEREVAKPEKAAVGSLVTIELLDTGKISQFLITKNERSPEELPPEARDRLPEGFNLAHEGSPLARAVMGKTTEDEDLQLQVTKSRPFRILEVKTL